MMMPFFQSGNKQARFREILESWKDTPYLHLARVKGRGADCALFIVEVLHEFGIVAYLQCDYYSRDWFLHTKNEIILDGFTKQVQFLSSHLRFDASLSIDTKLMFGDILCFCTNKNEITNHVAVYMGNALLYHSVPCRGVGYSQYGSYWQKKIVNILRVCEI